MSHHLFSRLLPVSVFAAAIFFTTFPTSCDSPKNVGKNDPPASGEKVESPSQQNPSPTTPEGGIVRREDPAQSTPPQPSQPIPPSGETNPTKPTTPAKTVGKDCFDPAKANDRMMCPDLYDPVCGCDGKDYSNACDAKRKGVLKWEKGPCKH